MAWGAGSAGGVEEDVAFARAGDEVVLTVAGAAGAGATGSGGGSSPVKVHSSEIFVPMADESISSIFLTA